MSLIILGRRLALILLGFSPFSWNKFGSLSSSLGTAQVKARMSICPYVTKREDIGV